MRNMILRIWILPFVLLISLFGFPSLAHADHESVGDLNLTTSMVPLQSVGPTAISIEPIKPLALGDHPTVVVHLTGYKDLPIANVPIYVLVDETHQRKAITDNSGTAYVPLLYKFSSKTYQIVAEYRGSKSLNLLPSRDETEMVVKPSNVSLKTVPPIPGIRFLLNQDTYISDENGAINFIITESGMYTLKLLPIPKEVLPPNTRLEFSRWNDNVFEPVRELHFPRPRPLEAGFIFKYQVSQIFLGPDGQVVDPARVSMMSLRGVGKTYTFEEAGPHWLPANRLIRRVGEHLESQPIPYYARNITIDGSNVINSSEQRFHIHPDYILPINVLVYSARFSARDAMFNLPIGSGVQLEYPDGHYEEFTFDSKAEIDIDTLARGSYRAAVIGAGGSAPLTPIHLSRDQDVSLLVLSYLDMAVIFGVPLMFALALLLIGRPHLVTRASQKVRSLYNSVNVRMKSTN